MSGIQVFPVLSGREEGERLIHNFVNPNFSLADFRKAADIVAPELFRNENRHGATLIETIHRALNDS